jgi:predicted dinucleotide-binding enzyme
MKIGIIGSGKIGGTLASLLLKAGHEVVIANSRGPESLGEVGAKLGPRASFRSALGGPIPFVVSLSNHRTSTLRRAQGERMILTAISTTRY